MLPKMAYKYFLTWMKFMNILHINYAKRVYDLDLFRAIAILLVVTGHGKFILKGTGPSVY